MRTLISAILVASITGCGNSHEPQPTAAIVATTSPPIPTDNLVIVPVPAEPVPAICKPMDNNYAAFCANSANSLIEKSITQIEVTASVQSNYKQLMLDPRGNQWEATHILIAPVVFTLPSGQQNKQIWAIYCADNEPIHVEHCYFGNIPAE